MQKNEQGSNGLYIRVYERRNKKGIEENPKRFSYTNYILAMVEELELNPIETAQGAYEGIVKEFVSYVK